MSWFSRGFLVVALLAASTGCRHDAPLPSSASEALPATVVLLVRHAEKDSDGTPDPPLTDAGTARAKCLATMLVTFAPDHLFATEYRRTQDTVAPLAKATGTEVEVRDAGGTESWVTLLRGLPPGSRAVVAGHSNTVPALVAALGGELSGLNDKGHFPHDEYDRLVHVVLDGQGNFVSAYALGYCQ